MPAADITDIRARQVFDSRGRPTVEAEVIPAGGGRRRASVPSGASRGGAETFELRDGDPDRHEGRGVLEAVANVNGEIRAALGAGSLFCRAFASGRKRTTFVDLKR